MMKFNNRKNIAMNNDIIILEKTNKIIYYISYQDNNRKFLIICNKIFIIINFKRK